MPRMNGIELLQKLKAFYQHFDPSTLINTDYKTFRGGRELNMEEPTYVFLTAYMTMQFKSHIRSLGV